ncbi:MAG: DUF4115 domain-containing protein [Rhodobacteraceae bacterium]|nr:DUF4115 domain-containing protein [Paracoccaceae bacterium]
MIGRVSSTEQEAVNSAEPKSFDDFELKLGDMMRGERATMGKSLLDVQRELRIKAAYVAAIENADPSAFDTPGFVAGYVRSYARYLGMDPDDVFDTFCRESGFATAHGMSPEASVIKKSPTSLNRANKGIGHDPFAAPGTPFVPESNGFMAEIEFRAVGSVLVLLAVIGGLGFGGWTLLRKVQQVSFAPIEQVPDVQWELDPVTPVGASSILASAPDDPEFSNAEALDRLYRPQALDVPVMTPRDGPIGTLDPREQGTFPVPTPPQFDLAVSLPVEEDIVDPVPQVVEEAPKTLRMVAVRPAWVRVRAADGSVIFEGIMEPGSSWDVPSTETPPTLRAGESGAVYFALGDTHYGPLGQTGVVTSNVPLSIEEVTTRLAEVDISADQDLERMVAEAAQLREPGAEAAGE